MTRTARLRFRVRHAFAATALIGAAVAVGPAAGVHAQTCADVVSFARAISTVARVDASNGAALAVPATYSQLVYDSIPSVAYNQSGPSTTGQLEDPTGTNPNTLLPTVAGFLPVVPPFDIPDDAFGTDPPFIPAPPIVGRAEAAFPTLQGIPQDSENSAGTMQSEAHAYPTYSQGRATSTGLGGIGAGSAFTRATMDCETLTLVVGWEASGVVTSGGTIPSMSQIATLVVTPQGASVDVATNVADETEDGTPILDGQPLANPILDEFNNQGTFVDVGEPRITVEDNRATVSGGGIRVGTADPERNDTLTFFTLGSLDGAVEFTAILPPFSAPENSPSQSDVSAPPLAPNPDSGDGAQTTTSVTESAGPAPPDASAAAQEFATQQIQLAGVTQDLTTGSTSLLPLLLALVAIVMIGRTAWFAADKGRDRFPTAGFTVDWLRARGQRFSTSYLSW